MPFVRLMRVFSPWLAALALLQAPAVLAQSYPARPIKLVVPFAPGGGTDFFARLLAQKLSEKFERGVIVDNRPGGGSVIGSDLVAQAPADGYTLLFASGSTYNAIAYKKLPYDPFRDFAAVSLVGRIPLLLVVNADFPARTLAEFISAVRARPRELHYGTPGAASPHHLATEYFLQRSGVEMVHVPYKGAGPALQDLIAGRIPMMFLGVSTALPQLKGGKIRALAAATAKRLAAMPDLPTIAESGFPGFDASAWQAITVAAGTPAPIIDRLNAELLKALADAGVQQKLAAAGFEPLGSSPGESAAYIRSETEKWTVVIKAANITAE